MEKRAVQKRTLIYHILSVRNSTILNMRKGFTLFELLIVVTIMGVIYAIVLQNFSFNQADEKIEELKLENIPAFLKGAFAGSKDKVTFTCYDSCSKCGFFVNNEELNSTENLFEKHSSPLVYTLEDERLEEVEFEDIFVNEVSKTVCFKYSLYPNQSTDRMVLEYKDKVYFYDNLQDEVKEFDSKEDAEEYWTDQREKVLEDEEN